MVKIYENKTTFNYSWDQVAIAFWKKYPNPESSHVLSEDTVYRKVKDGKLYSKRLLTKTNRLPKWGERFVTSRVGKIIEESVVDPQNKTLTTYTKNINYTSVMGVVEKVVYQVNEEDPSQTIAIRTAVIDSQVYGFARAIQAFGLERFKKNCSKAVNGFNYVLRTTFPQTHAINSDYNQNNAKNLQQAHSGKEKLKEAAKKAKELAKKQVFVNAEKSSN